jgi:hypothetical protein
MMISMGKICENLRGRVHKVAYKVLVLKLLVWMLMVLVLLRPVLV